MRRALPWLLVASLALNAYLAWRSGGVARAPMMGVYGPEGQWLIEQDGVHPDIVVDNLPHATFNGEDAQLDAAIAYLKKKIAEDPRAVPKPPPYPNKTRKIIP